MENLAIQAAISLATIAHKHQKYGDDPYTAHLAHVYEVLTRFKVTDEDLLVAAWLHDILEDTTTTRSHLELTFGKNVADLVYKVTNEAGVNRKARHAATYPKIVADERAVTLKLADRIANTERSIETNDDKLGMYAKEYPAFREIMYKEGVNAPMWRHLDFLMGFNDENH